MYKKQNIKIIKLNAKLKYYLHIQKYEEGELWKYIQK